MFPSFIYRIVGILLAFLDLLFDLRDLVSSEKENGNAKMTKRSGGLTVPHTHSTQASLPEVHLNQVYHRTGKRSSFLVRGEFEVRTQSTHYLLAVEHFLNQI